MNRLIFTVFLLTTNLSWWLMKQEKGINRFNGFMFFESDLIEWIHLLKNKILLARIIIILFFWIVNDLRGIEI